ncbi:MAG: Aminopeptidase YpdF [Chlamydiae bacterium]|nr:Aminopeptidase YpdF [Chlamydiota bacterium]
MTYPNYLTKRRDRLKKWLKENNLQGCLIQDPTNLFYYTGMHMSAGILFFTQKKQVLIADYRYAARCQQLAPFPVLATKSYASALKKLSFPKEMAVDGDIFTLSVAKQYASYTKIKSIPGLLGNLRICKDTEEIKRIKKSCEITAKGYTYIKKHFKEGVTEKELAFKLEFYLRKLGAEKMSFDPIVAFGKNSANPHYTPQDVKLKKNDVILIDSGCIYDGYCSDMTRTYLVGKAAPKMQRIYDLVAQIQKEAIEMCQVGVPLDSIEKATHTFFKKHEVDDLFIHSLGHGLGIEIHEAPRYNTKNCVEEGMVLTVEPGLYIDGLGGVRIEDTLLVTQKGPKILTQ